MMNGCDRPHIGVSALFTACDTVHLVIRMTSRPQTAGATYHLMLISRTNRRKTEVETSKAGSPLKWPEKLR